MQKTTTTTPVCQHFDSQTAIEVYRSLRSEAPTIIAKMYGNPPCPPKDEAEVIFAGIAKKYANIRKALRETAERKNPDGTSEIYGLKQMLEESENWRKNKAATPPYISTCDEFADVREHIHKGKTIKTSGMPIDEVLLLMEGGCHA